MPKVPVTGDLLYDCILAAAVLIIGFALGLKADKSWGYILVLVAVAWGILLIRGFMGV